MNTFRIENNEIQIYFDNIPPVEIRNQMKKINFRWDPASKVWHAPFSDERQRLALELASPDFPEDLPMQPKNEHETLINYIDSLLSSDNEEETGYINSLLLDKVPSELDTFVQAIRAYKDEENQASSDKKQQESSIKQTIDEIVARKKHAEKRRKLLESIIKEYILSTGESELRGDKFNVSFIKTSSFSISKELEEDIRRRADIPNWINIEVKINLNNFKKLKEVPQGVIESHGYKLQSWTKEEGDPNKKSYEISLEQFLEGKSIKEIAKERNLKWRTIYSHLQTAMDEGQLDINQYVGKDILYKLTTLAPHKEEWSIKEFQNALQVDIDYDLVALAMAYLKIWSAD